MTNHLPAPLARYKFYVSGSMAPATVYQDLDCAVPFPERHIVTADDTGVFPSIYLDEQTIYRVQVYDTNDRLLEDSDPVDPSTDAHFGSFSITTNQRGL